MPATAARHPHCRPGKMLLPATQIYQKGTPWLKVLKTLTAYRLLEPGSEWQLHRSWFDRSAMADLLDDDFRLAAKDTLYRRHDRLLDHREALFNHLKERWTGLFGACYDNSASPCPPIRVNLRSEDVSSSIGYGTKRPYSLWHQRSICGHL